MEIQPGQKMLHYRRTSGDLATMKHRIAAKLIAPLILLAPFLAVRAESVPFDTTHWEYEAQEHRIEQHLGREALFIHGGTATLVDPSFTNGTIEFDIAVTGERGFVGAFWRKQAAGEFEQFYVRPHQSGKPDATQYTPVFNGLAGWQLYHGEGYGAAVTYHNDQWMHVKIVFAGKRAEIYVVDTDTPAVVVHELKREVRSGRVGVSAGGQFAPAWFSNFEYREEEKPAFKGAFHGATPREPGTVEAWMVSSTFDEQRLVDVVSLDDTHKTGLDWTRLSTETSGTANLARVAGIGPEHNTVFARVTVVAEGEQVKTLGLGYSDRARVYLNGRLLYAGTNDYRSRDFRYLGTIGYFDGVVLPLREGSNELWIAISESFGGWGIKAKFEHPSGIELRAD